METEIDVCPNIKRETQDNILLAFIAARLWKNSPKRTKRLSSLKLKTYLVSLKIGQIIEKMSCLYTQIRSKLSEITNNYC